MSTFKKVVSLVLCLSMLMGIVVFAIPTALAAEETTTTVTSHTGNESVIDSMEDIKANGYADGSGKYFLYFGIDFYEEVADGEWELTDHYVQPGDTLRGYFYYKTNMYVGAGNAYIIFDRSFFDVTNGATGLGYDNTYDPNHADYPTEGYPGNIDGPNINMNHADIAANGNYYKYTTIWARNIPGLTENTNTNFCGIPLEESDTWDFWFFNYGRDANSGDAYRFDEDEHFCTFDVKVREFMPDGETKLEDGKTGFVKVDKRIYTLYCLEDKETNPKGSNRPGNISTLTTLDAYSKAKRMNVQTWFGVEDFLVDDCSHTFTIGEPEAVGVKKYNVTFLENDGTEISSADYKENTEVAVPDAVENELGWVNAATGKLVDTVVSGETVTATRNVTYQRVLTTDKFDVTVNLDGGTIDGEDTLVIKAGLGEEVDLTQYAPEKEGYEPVWDPASVTVDTTKGVAAKVKWEAKTFNVTFYLNKGDTEAINVVSVKYNAPLSSGTVSKEGYAFAGWYDVETEELASTSPSFGLYTKLEDSAYYAEWTQYPDSITFMAKNFKTGEWKPIFVVYGDGAGALGKATAPYTVNQLKAVKAKVDVANDLGWDGNVTFARGANYTSMTYSENYVQSEVIQDAVAFEGAKVIYIHAFPVYEIEFQVPVYDEVAGEYTDEYTTETKTLSTAAFEGVITYSKAALTAEAGYVFDKWVTEDGAQAEYNDSGANYVFSLSTAKPAKQVVKGQYKLEEYQLRFNIGTSDGQTVAPVEVKNIGDVLDIENNTFKFVGTGPNVGNTTKLPAIGVVNEDQEAPVAGRAGYKLIGWTLPGSTEVVTDLTNFEITSELAAKAYKANDGTNVILINSVWEAQNYDAKFYYWAPGSTIDNPVYDMENPIVISVPVGTGRDDIVKLMSDADIALLDASVPAGVTRNATSWRNEDGSFAAGKLPAGGANFYAVYSTKTFKLFVDLNNGKENSVKAYDVISPVYGEDVTVDRSETEWGVKRHAFNYGINAVDKPSEFHEIVDWKVYHVEDETTVKDPSTWHEGVNDEGTNLVRSTVIYQAQWKHHSEFLFRVYNVSGELTMALGKNFKWHYWRYDRITTKDNAIINTDPSMIILMFIPKLDGFSWDGFFSADMWKNVSLRIDPFFLPKEMFTWEAFIGLFKALGTAIGTLIKGTD
ncbi:MAG: InlB B-repeat-containing protein [Clostridia bacterium]|nr:InlB B-repeat-containing protein [Clostridia bacterium]